MKLIVVLLALVSTHVSALEVGECIADFSSKRYITKIFGMKYPKTRIFTCEYECKSEAGIDRVKALTNVTYGEVRNLPWVNAALDAKTPVCQGVQVEQVSQGWDHTGTNSFYAFDTKLKEVKEWARNNLSKDSPIERKRLTKLKLDLFKIGTSFIISGAQNSKFEYMKEAGITLNEIASELPQRTDKLDKYIDCLARDRGNVVHPLFSSRRLINTMLETSAAWRIPELD